MSNYTKSTNFATKDTLTSGDPLKIVKGTEINTEFDNISTAIATKSDTASPTFTGTVTIPTLSVSGTAAITGVATLTANPVLSAGTANGVTYLNGSKSFTSGSTFVFDGTNVGIGTASPSYKLEVKGSSATAGQLSIRDGTGDTTVSGNNAASLLFQARDTSIRTIAEIDAQNTATNGTGGAMIFQTRVSDVLAERMRIDSSGNVLINTTTAQTGAKLAVTGGIQGTITSGTAVTSTSGTSIDFTSIPSWVKRLTVLFNGVSTNGTSNFLIQIGSGSIQTTGYVSGSEIGTTTAISTVGMILLTGSTTLAWSGIFTFASFGSNTWISGHSTARSSDGGSNTGGGTVTLSGALDRVRITTVNGTDTFDAGSINIMYEG